MPIHSALHRAHRWIVLSAAVVALSACSSDSLPPLALASASGEAKSASIAPANASGVPTPAPTTTFPEGPSDGPVLDPTGNKPSRQRVQALATALGASGSLREEPGGWIVAGRTATDPTLIVFKDERSSWQYATGISCDLSVAPENGSGTCSITATPESTRTSVEPSSTVQAPPASPPSSPLPIAPSPSGVATPDTQSSASPAATTEVEPLAAAVLQSGGIDDAARIVSEPIELTSASDVVQYTGSPVIEALPTSGLNTLVVVGTASGRRLVISGSGSLATWKLRARYATVSAQEALQRWSELPQPALALCPIAPDGSGCLPVSTPTVTSAEFGLMLDTDTATDNHLVLAPAWLFTTEVTAGGTTSSGVTAISAVQDRYRQSATAPTGAPPSPSARNSGGVSTPEPSSGSVPGSTGGS